MLTVSREQCFSPAGRRLGYRSTLHSFLAYLGKMLDTCGIPISCENMSSRRCVYVARSHGISSTLFETIAFQGKLDRGKSSSRSQSRQSTQSAPVFVEPNLNCHLESLLRHVSGTRRRKFQPFGLMTPLILPIASIAQSSQSSFRCPTLQWEKPNPPDV